MATQQQKRPAPVTVIGYLNIIFGILWILGFLCGGLGLLMLVAIFNSTAIDAEPEGKWSKEMLQTLINSHIEHIPYITEVTVAEVLFLFAMTLLLLIAGIGLLRMKSWARKACIFYGVVTLLVYLALLGYNIAVVSPNMGAVKDDLTDWLANNPNPKGQTINPLGDSSAGANIISTSVGTCLWSIYPIIVLILMLLPSVAAAFHPRPEEPPPGTGPGPAGPGADDEYYGYGGSPEDRGY